ncbi:hypothetical protein LOK55_07280 [Microbacterium sp. F2E]|uniref:hypothetical protein n=1 Tax=Microbacterium sp. F2E TaxID=2895284 RepID=UPI001E336A48|nr:hypothetical protein [Microbacterium sp. F2E]MCC9054095.1 hypothetical protein [Microbacterium sp. F2E]
MSMIWRRYRSTLGLAIVASAMLGLFCGLALYLTGNADYRAQAGWGGLFYWIALGAGFGIGTGLTACAGGVTAIWLRDRQLGRPSASRVLIGTVGASVGAAVLWLAFGVVAAVTGGAGYLYMFIGIAVMAGLTGAVLARTMLSRAERRRDGDVVEFRFNV